MKCQNCGARVKKSEEICPECGKYITSKKYTLSDIQPTQGEINTEELEKAEERVKNLDDLTAEASKPEKYEFKDYLIVPTLIKAAAGIFAFVACIFTIVDNSRFYIRSSSLYTMALVIIFAFFCIFNAISSIIQEKKCVIEITDDKVFGTIPSGTFATENIEVNIEDIVAVEKEGFHSKYSSPKVHIVTAENRITVRASSTIMLSDLADALEKRIQK